MLVRVYVHVCVCMYMFEWMSLHLQSDSAVQALAAVEAGWVELPGYGATGAAGRPALGEQAEETGLRRVELHLHCCTAGYATSQVTHPRW